MTYDNWKTTPTTDERWALIEELVADLSDAGAITRYARSRVRYDGGKAADVEDQLLLDAAIQTGLVSKDWILTNDLGDIFDLAWAHEPTYKSAGETARAYLVQAMYYDQR